MSQKLKLGVAVYSSTNICPLYNIQNILSFYKQMVHRNVLTLQREQHRLSIFPRLCFVWLQKYRPKLLLMIAFQLFDFELLRFDWKKHRSLKKSTFVKLAATFYVQRRKLIKLQMNEWEAWSLKICYKATFWAYIRTSSTMMRLSTDRKISANVKALLSRQ